LWSGRDTDNAQRAAMRAIATKKDFRSLEDFGSLNLNVALRKLVSRDILDAPPRPSEAGEGWGEGYRFRVELVRRWVQERAA
ncbi:MAG: hypothetical protein HY327_08790, partial [Chloroflexi bacterium]|nr:hypothetical protein [Chloroflexota bacterium]